MIRYRLEEPYMDHRRCQVNMSHSFAPDSAVRNFYTAAVTYNALILGPFILAARTFPVTLGTENTLAKQAVFLRTICTIVNRLRLANLSE